MAKNRAERIIDTSYTAASGSGSGSTTVLSVSGGGGSGATTFLGLTDAPASYTSQADKFVSVNSGETAVEFVSIADADLTGTTVVLESRTITAGDGLDGGGDLTADRTLTVDVTDFIGTDYGLVEDGSNNIRVNLHVDRGLEFVASATGDRETHLGDTRTTAAGDTRISVTGSTVRSIGIDLPSPSGLTVDSTGLYIADTIAGNGLSIASKVLAVNVGDGLEIATDTVQIDLAATSGLTFSSGDLAIADTIAGDGLTISSKVLAVQVGDGLDISADTVIVDVTDFIDTAAGLTESSNNIQINAGFGLQFDTGALEVNEGATYNWTANHTFDTNTLIVSATQDAVWVNAGTPDGSAAFKVQSAVASDITFFVRQIGSQTADLFRVEDSGGSALLLIQEDGALESGATGFVSGTSGWQIAPDGSAEFSNITARGEFHASVFVADEFRVANDSEMWAPGGVLLADMTTIASGETYTRHDNDGDTRTTAAGDTRVTVSHNFPMDIEDPETGHATIFSVGDYLRVKDWTSAEVFDEWMSVVSIVDETTFYRYWVRNESGTPTTISAGKPVISYGQTGEGRLFATSTQSFGPYIETFKTGAAPWTANTLTTRMGRIDGVGVVSGSEQYGIVMGRDLSDTSLDSPYIVASDTQFALNNVDLTLYDSSDNPTGSWTSDGDFKLGSDVDNALTTLIHFDQTADTVTIGNSSQTAAVTIYGNINITNASSISLGDFSNATTGFTNDVLAQGARDDIDSYFPSGDLVTAVAPGNNAPVGTQGLYLGADKMGFHDGSNWKTYTDSSGNFYLNGTSGTFAYAASTGDLTIGGNGATGNANLFWDQSAGRLNFRDSTTVKAYIDTDGTFKAGIGQVTIDDSGITIADATDSTPDDTNIINWTTGGNNIARIWGYSGGEATLTLDAGGSAVSQPGKIILNGITASDTVTTSLTLNSNTATTTLKGTTVRLVGTIYKGASGTDAFLTEADEGHGNGLDADTLDTYEASDLLDSDNFTGTEWDVLVNVIPGDASSLHTHSSIYYTKEDLTNENATGIELDSAHFDGTDWGLLTGGVDITLHSHDWTNVTDKPSLYTQGELSGDGTASVHWNNLTNIWGTGGWSSISLNAAAWTASSGYFTPGYMIVGSMVFLRGRANQQFGFSSTFTGTALPVGARPASTVRFFDGISSGTVYNIEITTAGVINVDRTTGPIQLDGLFYSL